MNKKKVLIFHPAIAPYRIAFFNEISASFDTTICLYYRNLKNQKFNYELIEKQFIFDPHYFEKSITIGKRTIYLGHLKRIRKENPDIVIVSEYGEGLWSSVFCRFLSRKKYKILTICDDSVEIAANRKGGRKLARDLAVKMIDGIILCNDGAEKWYSRYGIPTFAFPIIQREQDFYSDREDALKTAQKLFEQMGLVGKRIFLFVGRLSPEKNLTYLLKSFAVQHERNPENMLFIVGDSITQNREYKEQLLSLADKLDANDYIRFVGRKEGTELKAWYYLGQVFVLPSIWESFGAVVNEALLAGEYVMVSKVAGSCCLVNECNGEIIDVQQEHVDFDTVSEKIPPLISLEMDRVNRMPYEFEDNMRRLLMWIERADAEGGKGI